MNHGVSTASFVCGETIPNIKLTRNYNFFFL